jgi:hypothetical protein
MTAAWSDCISVECPNCRAPVNAYCVSLTVTLQPLTEHIDENTELRMFAHVTARNGAWTWELFQAHWTDIPDECAVYIGRWPD